MFIRMKISLKISSSWDVNVCAIAGGETAATPWDSDASRNTLPPPWQRRLQHGITARSSMWVSEVMSSRSRKTTGKLAELRARGPFGEANSIHTSSHHPSIHPSTCVYTVNETRANRLNGRREGVKIGTRSENAPITYPRTLRQCQCVHVLWVDTGDRHQKTFT